MRVALACLAAAAVVVSPAAADAKKKKPAKVVCFKKRGKKVCRKKPAAVPKPRVTPLAPALPAPSAVVAGPSPAPAAPAVAKGQGPVPTAAAPAPAPAPKPDCGTSPWVGLTAADVDGTFRFTGKRTCVPTADVRFQVRNTDAQEHNLYAEGIAPAVPARAIIASVAPGETVEAAATLPAGEWRLYCSIEGHGTMSRTLTVQG